MVRAVTAGLTSVTLPCCSFCRWNDKKAKMHYVLFCMPEISPSKLYLLRKGTDVNRYERRIAGAEYAVANMSVHVRLSVCTDLCPAASCLSTSVTILTVRMRIILQLSQCLYCRVKISRGNYVAGVT